MAKGQVRHQHTNEKRKSLVNLVFNHRKSVKEAAYLLNINYKTASKICNRFDKTGAVEKGKPTGSKRQFGTPVKRKIVDFFDRKNDATLEECRKHLIDTGGEGETIPSLSTIDRIISKDDYTMKDLSVIPPQRNTPERIKERKKYVQKYLSMKADWNFMSCDEFGCNKGIRRGRGRSKRGQPAFVTGPLARGANISVCVAIDKTGVLHHISKFGAIDSDAFCDFLNGLGRVLDKSKNNILMLDNHSVHKTDDVKQALKENNIRVVFLPAYSPFLQPIELCFSKVKGLIKKKLSDGAGVFEAIEDSLPQVTAEDCMAWYDHTERFFSRCLNEQPVYKDWHDEEANFSSDDELLQL